MSEILGGPVSLRDYVAIARPDHWVKNAFMLPGAALAFLLDPSAGWHAIPALALAVAATCLIASANYTINEWLDAHTDRHHPVKSRRPSALGRIRPGLVYLQYALLALTGLGLAALVGWPLVLTEAVLLGMGVLYNVPPIRTKDRAYLDVLSESVNNPLRLLLGWFAITAMAMPPGSILACYWMGGAYLMALKRFAEYRMINDPARAGLYRRSFQHYTETSLLVSAFFYAITAALLLGVFLIKYRIEFLLSFPFFALLFAWYLAIALRSRSDAINPEKLYREKPFMAYTVFLVLLVMLLFVVEIPGLQVLVSSHALDGIVYGR